MRAISIMTFKKQEHLQELLTAVELFLIINFILIYIDGDN